MSEKKKKSKKVKKDPLNKILASIKKEGPIINKYYTYNKGGVTKASEGKPANSSYDSYVEMFVNAVDKATDRIKLLKERGPGSLIFGTGETRNKMQKHHPLKQKKD